MFGLQAGSLFTIHQGQAGGRGLSPRLWARANAQSLSPDGFSNAYYDGDDFVRFGTIAPAASGTTGGMYNGYAYYVDTSTNVCSIQQIATEVGGVLRLLTSADDNDDANLQAGGTAGVFGKISDTAGADKLLIFEARFRVNSIANSHNFFIGMAEEGCAITDGMFTDAGALADKDMIGFHVLEADGDALNFGYKKAGQTAVTKIAGVQVLAADTWYKVGFIYDPAAVESKRIKVFVDNVEQSTYVTATNIATATFPDAEELSTILAIKNGSAAAKALDVDWWACFQAGVGGT